MGRWPFRRKPSTRAFNEEADRVQGYSLFDRLHGHFYLKWPYFYIGMATGRHPMRRYLEPVWRRAARLLERHAGSRKNGRGARQAMADTYHGKVVPPPLATRLVTVDRDVTLTDLERVIPYPRARDIILRNPDHIAVLECPCRSARAHPCLPLDVCLIVGEPFASYAVEHHPGRSRRIGAEEATEIIRAEHERGHVHHAFFKDAVLGRFYAICNCCSCCCGAMQAHRHGVPMLASSGFVCRLEADACQGCGMCVEFCPFDAMKLGEATVEIDEERCMGCGVCVSKCELEALRLERDPAKGEPLDIQAMISGGDGCLAVDMLEAMQPFHSRRAGSAGPRPSV